MNIDFYTITETAKMLGIHERNVKELIRLGRLQTVKINDKVKVSIDSINELLPGFKHDPNPDREVKKQKHPVKKDFIKREMEQKNREEVQQYRQNPQLT